MTTVLKQLYLFHTVTRKYIIKTHMQEVSIQVDDLTGVKERLITMSISKTTGIMLDDTDNAESFKATIARLNRESDMYFTQKTINGKLFIRRVA